MRINQIIQGLTILQKYYNDPNGYHTGADHDVIYAYKTDKELSSDDLNKMYELDWFQDGSEDDPQYQPDEGWKAYT